VAAKHIFPDANYQRISTAGNLLIALWIKRIEKIAT
jgi:hypothetical protein